MDVRCDRCRAQYAVDDARVPEAGIKVACAQCGHAFLLRKKTLAVTVPLKGDDPDVPTPVGDLAGPASTAAVERSEWRLRQPGGAIFPFRELSTLQRWIVERKAARDDEVAAAGEGEAWRRLGDIPELQSFFALLEKAQRRREASPGAAALPPESPPPEPVHTSPGMEDPAWARGPIAHTRRVSPPVPKAPRPRRRVVWVALLALGLLGVAAVGVYLGTKADADAKAASAEAAAQALAAAARQPAPERTPEPRPDPRPEPRAEVPPPAPAPTASPEPAQAPTGATGPTGPTGPSGVAGAPAEAAAPPPAQEAAPAPAPSPVVATPPAPTPSPPPSRPTTRPPPREDPAGTLRALLTRAREQRERGRCEAALDLYGQALTIDGRNAAALAGRGACYLDLSRYDQAEASFEAAIEADPRNAEALFGLAETYRYMGRKDQAVAFYERFLAVRPNGDDAAAARRLVSQLKE